MDGFARFDWPALAQVAIPVGIALLLGMGVRQLLLALALARRVRGSQSLRALILRAVSVPAAFAVPLLLVAAALRYTPLSTQVLEGLRHAIAVALTGALTWLSIRLVQAAQDWVIARHPVDVDDNLAARRIQTQTRVLARVATGLVLLLGVSAALMTFPAIRQVGTTLLASAGILGVVAGIAARPVFGNLIAGLQIALTQPIRLDDVVIVEGEWGRVEEITTSYVVVRLWDERRMVVPLSWFIENPFQNWTRRTACLLGEVFLWLDYRTPMEPLRAELRRICTSDPRWDGRVCIAQVTDTDRHAMQVRLLVSAGNSGDAFDLRCAVRERMVDFLQREHPEALPRLRANVAETERPERRWHRPSSAQLPNSPRAEDSSVEDSLQRRRA
ncbi:MAG TPA: mechanosensitive ion channel domain-containing protein [Lysobacter sp.]|nr:mechanosensitive ion channel domain-containing protein [Lysobacter sp.]